MPVQVQPRLITDNTLSDGAFRLLVLKIAKPDIDRYEACDALGVSVPTINRRLRELREAGLDR